MKYKIVFKEIGREDKILGLHFKLEDEIITREAYAEFKKEVEAIIVDGKRYYDVKGLYRINRIGQRAILTKIC